MKTLIYGAGPLGSMYAGRLHQAGVEVTLLARGQRLADLRQHGVVLEDAFSGSRETYPVPVAEQLGEDDPYDLILVVMRKDQSKDILPTLANNRHAHTILFLQNNPAGFAEYIKALGAERVMAGFPSSGGERNGAVMRVMPMDMVSMPVGEVDGRITDRTRQVAALLKRTGKKVEIRRDMDAWLVSHVPAIGVFAGLYAADLDADRYARTPDAMLLGVRLREEALKAQAAAGVPISPAGFKLLPWIPEPLAVAMLRGIAGTEFFQVGVLGHSRAAADEMAHILQEYRQRVRPGGMPTPMLDRALEHIKGTRPPLPEGSSQMSMNWRGVWIMGAVLLSFVVFVRYRRLR